MEEDDFWFEPPLMHSITVFEDDDHEEYNTGLLDKDGHPIIAVIPSQRMHFIGFYENKERDDEDDEQEEEFE